MIRIIEEYLIEIGYLKALLATLPALNHYFHIGGMIGGMIFFTFLNH